MEPLFKAHLKCFWVRKAVVTSTVLMPQGRELCFDWAIEVRSAMDLPYFHHHENSR